jgi:hypothetical protein
MIFFGHCFAYSAEVLSIDRKHLIGHPLSLSSQVKIYISDHELTLMRWSLAQKIDDVIQNFSRQVPEDTLVWSDGLVMHMLWSSTDYSHVLALRPESDECVMVTLSSMRLKPLVSNGSIKSLFSNPRVAATLMLDVKDHSEDVMSSTMIFSSEQSIPHLYKVLRQILSLENWSVNDDFEKILSRSHPRTIQARLLRKVVNMDLIDYLGKTFIYVHTSEGDRR